MTDYLTYGFGLTSGVASKVEPDTDALYAVLRAGDDRINGNDQSKTILGYEGNDTIRANGGDDWMNGGSGQDLYYGGPGNDGVYFLDASANQHGVHLDLSLATGTIQDDGFGNVENVFGVEKFEGSDHADVLKGGSHDDAFFGDGGNDTLTGGGGGDQLYGNDGNDSLNGRAGNDTLEGGSGRDQLMGGGGEDVLVFWDVAAPDGHGVNVNLANAAGQVIDDDYGQTETVSGFEDLGGSDYGDRLMGNGRDNSLWGNAGNDPIYGVAGYDLLYGGDGRDKLFGGAGFNAFHGGAGQDTITGGPGLDWFVFDTPKAMSGYGDKLLGVGANDVVWIPTSWAADLLAGGLSTAQFESNVHGTTPSTAAVRIFHSDDSWFYFDPDGNGSAHALRLVEIGGTSGFFTFQTYDLT